MQSPKRVRCFQGHTYCRRCVCVCCCAHGGELSEQIFVSPSVCRHWCLIFAFFPGSLSLSLSLSLFFCCLFTTEGFCTTAWISPSVCVHFQWCDLVLRGWRCASLQLHVLNRASSPEEQKRGKVLRLLSSSYKFVPWVGCCVVVFRGCSGWWTDGTNVLREISKLKIIAEIAVSVKEWRNGREIGFSSN